MLYICTPTQISACTNVQDRLAADPVDQTNAEPTLGPTLRPTLEK